MTAITLHLHLPDDKAARLRARAEASGEDPDAFAVAAVLRALDEEDADDELTPDDLAAIGAGLDALDAGRVTPGPVAFAQLRAHLDELKQGKQAAAEQQAA